MSAPPAIDPIPASVWRVAGVVVFGAIMSMLDTSLVNIGLDTIAADLGAGLDGAQWIASGYLLALAVTLPLCGWLGRRIGLDRVWVGALIGFTVASALCAFAPTMGWLIALRIVQGLAAGLLTPAGQALIGQVAGPHRLGRVMSVTGIAVVGAPAIGPTVGGVMLEHLHWSWLFLINIPFGLVAFVLAVRFLPRVPASDTAARLDIVGFVLIAVGLSALVYGLGEFGTRGSATAPTVWVSVLVGVLALGVFLVRSIRSRTATLLDVGLFRSPVFAAANVANFFVGVALFGSMLLLPLYFQILHGEGLIATGLLLLSFGLGGVIALPIGGLLTDRFGGGAVATVGGVVLILTTLPFVFGDADLNPVLIQVLLLLRGMATGFAAMPIVSSAYAAVRPHELPDAASFVNIVQRMGGAIGAALLAVVVYRASAAGLPVEVGFQRAFGWLTAAAVVSLGTSIILWRRESRSSMEK
ncbi:DHA2 family efflux MFS transporter permease subunit [Nocardia bovistercoris]|uniref:DHA2 family efflux MFS transporter permease subunit n=1 Tax=Nocardia bovistercoris TaxID=2785916 RepID=UPI002FCCD32C